MDLPGGRGALPAGGADVFSIELHVLSRGFVFEVDFTTMFEGEEDHFLFFVMKERSNNKGVEKTPRPMVELSDRVLYVMSGQGSDAHL